MGQYGIATQPPGGSLVSTIQGPLGALTVSVPKGSTGTGNINGEFINVTGNSDGTIGQVTVTGSLIGGAGDYSGEISATGNIGNVTVGGSVLGAAGVNSGSISATGNLGNVTVNGSLVGSTGFDTDKSSPAATWVQCRSARQSPVAVMSWGRRAMLLERSSPSATWPA